MDEAALTALALCSTRDLDELSIDAQVDSDDSFRCDLVDESENESDDHTLETANISAHSASLVLSSHNSSTSLIDACTLFVSYPTITDPVDTDPDNLSASELELPPIPDSKARKSIPEPIPTMQRIDIPPNPSASGSPYSQATMLAMDCLSPMSNAPPPSYSARSPASTTLTVSPSMVDASPCLSPVAAQIRRRKQSVDIQSQIPDFMSSSSVKDSKRKHRKKKRQKAKNPFALARSVSNGKASHFASFGGSQSVDVDAMNERVTNYNPFRVRRRVKVKFLCNEKRVKGKGGDHCGDVSENENEYAVESEDGFMFYTACESV